MAIFSVYAPQGETDMRRYAERTVFVAEGFTFFAFALTPFWLLRYRLWLRLLQWFVLSLILGICFAVLDLPLEVKSVLSSLSSLCLALWFGLEAVNMRARKLENQGWLLVDVVVARNLAACEEKFFGRVNHAHNVRQGFETPAAAKPAPSVEIGVVGLFPDAPVTAPLPQRR